jgi:predicted nucleotidyltransferase
MKAVGLITEYNPFHNGHLYHLQQSRLQTDAEACVAVMSGHFLQRGEPALLDKWLRAKMALACGVDLLVELPLPWACNSAPLFADGAVYSLHQLQVDSLCFGSESGSLPELQDATRWLCQYSQVLNLETRNLLRQGKTWPQARSIVADNNSAAPQIQEALKHPNNILGLEYLRAITEMETTITASTIKRVGAGYHDESIVHGLASATGIRMRVAKGEQVGVFLPDVVSKILCQAQQANMTIDQKILHSLLIYALQQDEKRIENIYQVDVGMRCRLQQSANEAVDYSSLVDTVKSKQVTRTRVQRLLSYVLLGLEAGLMSELLDCGPLYLHLLGQSQIGEKFLGLQRKNIEIPLISNYSRVHNLLNRHYSGDRDRLRLAQELLRLELRATKMYSLLLPGFGGGNRNRDFYQSVIRQH